MNKCKIAYLIIVHTDAAHLERLVNAIDYKAHIFIHLDAKSRISDFANIKLPKSAEFIGNRVRISWGAFSMVEATLNLIKAALDYEEEFSHLVLLSGSDYPIKPSWMIHDFLTNNPNKQFIRFVDMTKSITSVTNHMERILRYWFWEPFFFSFPTIDKYIRLILLKLFEFLRPVIYKQPLEDVIPAFGSQWWALTPECASYILQFLVENPHFSDFYKYSHAPDEHFFHTIVANSPYLAQTNGIEDNINYGPPQLSNLHIIDLAKGIFHESDFDFIKMSDKFFVRKVTSVESFKLIEMIDKELLTRLRSSHQ